MVKKKKGLIKRLDSYLNSKDFYLNRKYALKVETTGIKSGETKRRVISKLRLARDSKGKIVTGTKAEVKMAIRQSKLNKSKFEKKHKIKRTFEIVRR